MSGTDLEKHEPAIAHTSTELDRVARLGMWLAAAESNSTDPKARGMAAALRIAWAESLGLASYGATEVHIIKGQPTLSAKAFRALAHQHGIRVEPVDDTAESCTAVVYDRHDQELGRRTFTLEQAKRRGIWKASGPWSTMPERMLWARASKEALDYYAPWVTVGVMSVDEAVDAELVDAEDIPFGDPD